MFLLSIIVEYNLRDRRETWPLRRSHLKKSAAAMEVSIKLGMISPATASPSLATLATPHGNTLHARAAPATKKHDFLRKFARALFFAAPTVYKPCVPFRVLVI